MRTTLNIDNELLIAVKELAHREQKTAGLVVSELLRQALQARLEHARGKTASHRDIYGFQPVPSRGNIVTNQYINHLREEVGD